MDNACRTVVRRSRVIFIVGFLLLLAPGWAGAAEISLQSETLFRFMQRDTLTTKDAAVLPIYEYLQVDAGSLNARGLSLHLYGWGRADLGDGDYYRDDSSGELLYGYLEYTRPFSNFNLRLGRQYVIAGLANDSIDGLFLRTDLGPYFALSAYGGLPVAFDTTAGRSGDSIYGGRLAHHFGTRYEIGLSYQQVANDSATEDQQVGIDLAFTLPAGISFSGRSSYNLESEGWGEHFYEARFSLADFHFRPFYESYDYRDYFASGEETPNPFNILSHGNEALTAYGTDLLWTGLGSWELGAKIKFFNYDVNSDSAAYYAAILTWHGAGLTQAGGEIGAMQGDAASNNYLLGRLFFYWDKPVDLSHTFVSGDLFYAAYDKSVYGQDGSFFASLGAGHRFLDERLELKLSGDYSSDPNFDSDWRGMLVASYRFGR